MKLPAALLAAAFAVPAFAQAAPTVTIPSDSPVLGISVTEHVEAAPDVALIDAGVSTVAPTAQAALTQNAQKMSRVVERLIGMGIAKRDIQTTGISVNPQYSYPNRQPGSAETPPRIVGYNASNTVRVRYRDIPKLGGLLDTLVSLGANQINGPFFQLDEPAAQLRSARDRALEEAGRQADYYAAKVGGATPRLLSVTESGGQMPYPPQIVVTGSRLQSFDVQEAAATPVAPGQVATSVTLFVQYALDR